MRRFIAVDDCGIRINPMIVEGQIHGGLAEGVGIALMELIAFDEQGNCLGGSFMDYLIPTAMEVPDWELGETVTPSPHHPIGAKGVGESPTVGSPPAIVNAVIDALHEPLGVDHIDMPCTPGAGVGGDAGQGDAAAVITTAARRAARGAAGRAPRVRQGDGRPRAEPDERPRRATRRSCCADGTIDGFVGGVVRRELGAPARRCACWRRASRCCCGSCPSAGGDEPAEDGAVTVAQPVPERRRARDLPRAARCRRRGCVVVGDAPVAQALRELGPHVGFEAAAPADGAGRVAARTRALVVASHGRDEERGARRGADGRRAVRRAGRQPRAAAPPCARALDVADELRGRAAHAGGAGHRRAHAGGDRAVDPRRDRRRSGRVPGAPRGDAARRRSPVRRSAERAPGSGVLLPRPWLHG